MNRFRLKTTVLAVLILTCLVALRMGKPEPDPLSDGTSVVSNRLHIEKGSAGIYTSTSSGLVDRSVAEDVNVAPARDQMAAASAARLIHWEDFKYGPVLEVREGERTLHKVANHLLIHSPEPVKAKIGSWLEEGPGRSIESLGGDTFLISWTGAEPSHHGVYKHDLRALLGEGAVVEPDWVVTHLTQPNDPLYAEQWHHGAIFAEQGWAVRSVAADVLVAVLDTGVHRDHPDLVANLRALPGEIPGTGRDDDGNGFIDDAFGWDFVDGNNNPADMEGHGTHIAGLIAATGNNQTGGVGVAWNAHLLPVRFLDARGRGTTSDEIRALDYARASGARIINASFGTGGFSAAARARYAALGEAGVWVVAAAGNDDVDTGRFPVYPASYGFAHIFSVGASTSDGRRAGFSNFGRNSVDLLAPGNALLSTALADGYAPKSGTSQAAALVSGALALVIAEYPAASVEEIRDRLIARARFSAAAAPYATGGILDLGHALAPGVGRPPVILTQPESRVVQGGETVTLEVDTVSSIDTQISWFRDGDPVPFGQGNALVLANFSAALEGLYTARVRDRFGEAMSAAAEVRLERIPPALVATSRKGYFQRGQALELFAEATGSAPLSFQWFLNGAPVPGQTQPRLLIPAATDAFAGDYFLRVINPFGSVDSAVIPVELDPLASLTWHLFSDRITAPIQRVGDVYFRMQGGFTYLSRDLFVWTRYEEPEEGVRLLAFGYGSGQYWGVEANGRLWRGSSPETLVRWIDMDWPSFQHVAPFFVFGQDHLLVGPSRHNANYFRVHPQSGEVRAAQHPNEAIGNLRAVDGVFHVGRRDSDLHTSADGLVWSTIASEHSPVVPLHTDLLTGYTVGINRADGALQTRAPGGSFAPLIFQGSTFAEHNLTPVPGGLRLSFNFPQGGVHNDVVHNFLTGETRALPRLAAFPPQPYTVSVFSDLQRGLRQDGTQWRLLDRTTGIDSYLFNGHPIHPSASWRSVFTMGDTAYAVMSSAVHALSPTGPVKVVSLPHATGHLVTTPAGAIFASQFDDPTRFYSFGMDKSLREIVPEVTFPAETYFSREGSGVVAHGDNDIWLSSDARSWRYEPDAGSLHQAFALGPHGWVNARTLIAGAARTLEIRFLANGANDWETVHTVADVPDSSVAIQSTGTHAIVISGWQRVFASANGRDWLEADHGLDRLALYMPPQGDRFLLRGTLTSEQYSANDWRASHDGLTWFTTTAEADVQTARAKGVVYSRNMLFARETSGLAVGAIAVRIDASPEQPAPARWTLEAGVPHPERAIRIELWSDNRFVEARPGGEGIVPFTIRGNEARVRLYDVRAIYEDGWVARSVPVRLTTQFAVGIEAVIAPGGPISIGTPPLRFLFSESRAFVFRPGENDLFVSRDGRHWEEFGRDLPWAFQYQGLHEFADGWSYLATTGYPGMTYIGILFDPEGRRGPEVHIPEGYQFYEIQRVPRDGQVYLFMQSAEVFLLETDGTWTFSHAIEGLPSTVSETVTSINVSTHGSLAAFEIRFHGMPSRIFLSSDFRSVWEAPPIPLGWTDFRFLGTVIRRDDHRAIRIRQANGHYGPTIELPFAVSALQSLDENTFIADADGLRWLVTTSGEAWPFDVPSFHNFAVWRTPFQIGLFANTGHITLYDSHDFYLTDVSRPVLRIDGAPRLRSHFSMRNDGVLSTATGAALLMRATLEPAGTGGGQSRVIGEKMLDVSRRAPGRDYVYALDWTVPTGVPLGEYRLRLEVNADGAVNELNRENNTALSPVFSYNPEASLLLAESPFGFVRSEDTTIGLAFGSTVRLEADPMDGFSFLQWSGTHSGHAALLDLPMDRRHQIRAHFVPTAILDIFPALGPFGRGGWYAEPGGPSIAPVTAAWSYHREWGWFSPGPIDASGAWLWFAEHGWLWRLHGVELYFDPVAGAWLLE